MRGQTASGSGVDGRGASNLARREVVLGMAAAGLSLATGALADTGAQQTKTPVRLQGREARAPHPPVEQISASYDIRGNFFDNKLTLEQDGAQIHGSYDDGTAIDGTVAGQRPSPVVVTFTRTLSDGTIQTYWGAVSTQVSGAFKNVQMSGVFHHNGSGPYPWNATGRVGD